jgi:hypothetical protein
VSRLAGEGWTQQARLLLLLAVMQARGLRVRQHRRRRQQRLLQQLAQV